MDALGRGAGGTKRLPKKSGMVNASQALAKRRMGGPTHRHETQLKITSKTAMVSQANP